MEIAVIYDFGINLGGGDFVMLNILEALRSLDYKVHLVTSYPKGLQISAKFFEKPVPGVDIFPIKVPGFLKHPYNIAYVASKAVKTMSNKIDIYITSDDIPACIANQRGVCYMHYPHAARLKFKEYVTAKYKKTLHGRAVWKIHEVLFPKFYVVSKKPKSWLLVANSIITRQHSATVFQLDTKEVVLLNPPVASRMISEMLKKGPSKKENLVVCVGRFEPEKRFTDVLQVLAHLRRDINDIELSLIGFTREEKNLLKAVKTFRLEGNVELLVNAERKTLINRLLRAKAIVHPTPHEPFGIAVVEGMAAGCIPIVRRGANGPWLEITLEGRYGLGFSDLDELAKAVEKAIKFYEEFDVNVIMARALEFDENRFKQRFMEVFKSFSQSTSV